MLHFAHLQTAAFVLSCFLPKMVGPFVAGNPVVGWLTKPNWHIQASFPNVQAVENDVHICKYSYPFCLFVSRKVHAASAVATESKVSPCSLCHVGFCMKTTAPELLESVAGYSPFPLDNLNNRCELGRSSGCGATCRVGADAVV